MPTVRGILVWVSGWLAGMATLAHHLRPITIETISWPIALILVATVLLPVLAATLRDKN